MYDGFGIKKFKPLLHDITRILIQPNGDFAGFRQYPNVNTPIDIVGPIALNFAQFVEGSNWYGQSDLVAAEAPHKAHGATEATALKYDQKAAGAHWCIHYPVGRSPYNGETEVDNGVIANDILGKLQANGSIAIPNNVVRFVQDMANGSKESTGWKIELIESTASISSSLETRLKYCDTLITRALLQPERSLLEGKHGTKSESETQEDVALTMVEHRHGSARQILNEGPVQILNEAHLGSEFRHAVTIESEPIGRDEKQFLREIYKSFLTSSEGAVIEMDAINFDELREVVGVPSLTESEREENELTSLTDENPFEEGTDPGFGV